MIMDGSSITLFTLFISFASRRRGVPRQTSIKEQLRGPVVGQSGLRPVVDRPVPGETSVTRGSGPPSPPVFGGGGEDSDV